MELYVLDNLLRRDRVVDRFESLIWTERFSAYGDFQLKMQSTRGNRDLFTEGTYIAMNESYRVMRVETVEDKLDEEGRKQLFIEGRSLETILEERMARDGLSDLTTTPKWVISGKPADVCREIFRKICIEGVVSPMDIIPGIQTDAILPTNDIPEPDLEETYELDLATVYKVTKDICDYNYLGFRLIRHPVTGTLSYDIYAGNDRTTAQTAAPAVVFTPELGNLQNTTEFTTSAGAKNVAYVVSPVGTEIVLGTDVEAEVSGFDRKVLVVEASDITDPDPMVASMLMVQRGKIELAKHRSLYAFDGEIPYNSQYRYGVDYNVGDLVEMRNSDGVTNATRVTEQIFVSDSEGERSYPTLSTQVLITPGSWRAWEHDQVWADFGLYDYWIDM